jgi:type II secretory pathway component PulF
MALFSRRLSLATVIALCRALRHNLAAGLGLRDVFRQMANRGPVELRPVADRILVAIDSGSSLGDALKTEEAYFPPLFLSLAGVGEDTGNLPEIFGELEKYYTLQQRFWRQFISQSVLPILQFVAATFVIAALLLILGWIAETQNRQPIDILGLGLVGYWGAVKFLVFVYGTIALMFLIYKALGRSLEQKATVDRVLLGLPVVGSFLWSLCLARFALALRLTLDSAMPIAKALGLSLRATGNAAFASKAEVVQDSLVKGEDLTTALTSCRLFPQDFINIIAVAEEGGRVPEVMENQAKYYEEEAERKLTLLTRFAGMGVWLLVATLIVMAIFRLALFYINILNQAAG